MPAERIRAGLVRGIYRFGWRVAARLPRRVVGALIRVAARAAVRRPGIHLQTLSLNLSVTTGQPCDRSLLRAGVRSYLRAFYEVLALPGWSADQVKQLVDTRGESILRQAYATTGAVVALPHSGNWDLAGAWACATGMPVTTVAERLGPAEYAAFVAFRERLGMEVMSHRDPGAVAELIGAVRRGRLVCLLADRDLAGSGVPVAWSGRPVTMPAGPAIVARRAGAALIPAVCQYAGERMLIRFGPVIGPRPGRTGLTAMMQEVADFFAATIAEQPEDWHMMQPFFADSARR